jgi:hypothetical protein
MFTKSRKKKKWYVSGFKISGLEQGTCYQLFRKQLFYPFLTGSATSGLSDLFKHFVSYCYLQYLLMKANFRSLDRFFNFISNWYAEALSSFSIVPISVQGKKGFVEVFKPPLCSTSLRSIEFV